MKPDLYIDVDGVMLFLNKTENDWLLNLIVIASGLGHFNRLFWLSCWTLNGKTDELYKRHPNFKRIGAKPLRWDKYKTEAIDWSKPFIWLEDGVLSEERNIFELKAVAGQAIWEIRPGEHSMNDLKRLVAQK